MKGLGAGIDCCNKVDKAPLLCGLTYIVCVCVFIMYIFFECVCEELTLLFYCVGHYVLHLYEKCYTNKI